MMKKVAVTGGAGFIGSGPASFRWSKTQKSHSVVGIEKGVGLEPRGWTIGYSTY